LKSSRPGFLIISHIQFGYHTGTYKYCEYLRNDFDVTYLGFDFCKAPRTLDGVAIKYIARQGNILRNYGRFIYNACKVISASKPDYIFMPYFFGTSLVNFYFLFSRFRARMIVDIRTSFIFSSPTKTNIANALLKLECLFFKTITVISGGLKQSLSLPKRTLILPLGGERTVTKKKTFEEILFLYVGTFYDRDIQTNLKAFIQFYGELSEPEKGKIKYYIIGYGPEKDITEIKSIIQDCTLHDVIVFVGEVRYPELNEYIEKCNIGVSYIPLKPYYDMQPPTKTFEYLVNGMLVLATATTENSIVINDTNGVCVKDDFLSQVEGFKKIYTKSFHADSDAIINSSGKYTWEYIINHILKGYLQKIR